jgi:hypothetical protein
MLVKITRERNGNISFDENLVCSIEFLRVIFEKFGKGAVAYVAWSADVDSEFYDLPTEIKEEQLSASCGIEKKIIVNTTIISAIEQYKKFCLNSPSGSFLSGYKKKLLEFGRLFNNEILTLENAETMSKIMKENATLADKINAIQKQYRDNEKEIQRFMIKGDRKPTPRENRQLSEHIKEKM